MIHTWALPPENRFLITLCCGRRHRRGRTRTVCHMRCFFIPPHISERLAENNPDAFRPASVMDAGIRHVRSVLAPDPTGGGIRVFDARRTWNSRSVPAAENLPESVLLKRYADTVAEVLGVQDFPDAVVRYGRGYCNAFWDGVNLVFGEGDNKTFADFTLSLDVFAHEYGHMLVEAGPGLQYKGESGALNEHLADVFGICCAQYVQGMCTDYRIGDEIFTDGHSALRDMRAPGTAYDNRMLGRDPQPAHMDAYVRTNADSGGVHINSGIPNHAFFLFREAVAVPSWGEPLRIWRDAMNTLSVNSGFQDFAGATVACAGDFAEQARSAWHGVGITV